MKKPILIGIIVVTVLFLLVIISRFPYMIGTAHSPAPAQSPPKALFSTTQLSNFIRYGNTSFSQYTNSNIEFQKYADDNFKNRLITQIQPFIYPINGLYYSRLEGGIQGKPEDLVVIVRGFINDKKQPNYDNYSFYFKYDQNNDNLAMVNKSFQGYAIPQELKNKAISEAKKNYQVQKFLNKYQIDFDTPERIISWQEGYQKDYIKLTLKPIIKGSGTADVLEVLIDPSSGKVIKSQINPSGQIID